MKRSRSQVSIVPSISRTAVRPLTCNGPYASLMCLFRTAEQLQASSTRLTDLQYRQTTKVVKGARRQIRQLVPEQVPVALEEFMAREKEPQRDVTCCISWTAIRSATCNGSFRTAELRPVTSTN